MPVSVDAGDRPAPAELGHVSRSHAVLTFDHLATQSESDSVSRNKVSALKVSGRYIFMSGMYPDNGQRRRASAEHVT